jgi:putative hydrolase of the HAD superfamily
LKIFTASDFDPQISAVTFDMYNTLLITEPDLDHSKLSARVFSRSLRSDGVIMGESDVIDLWTSSFDRSIVGDLTFFERRINTFLVGKGIQVPADSIRTYANDILDSWESRWSLVPDAIEVMSTLKQSGISVGLITNFDHYPHVRDLLKRLELNSLLDVTVISSEVGFDKPDRRIFQHALSQLNVAAGDAVHVGDDQVDIDGALGVGMRAVRIDHTATVERRDGGDGVPCLNSLSQLLLLLAR